MDFMQLLYSMKLSSSSILVKIYLISYLCLCPFFQDNVLALNKRLDHMEWKTEQMERQMGDWDREQGTMDKLTNNTQKAIDELTLVSVVTCL